MTVVGRILAAVSAAGAGAAAGPKKRLAETLWLDPALGYAPRRWEVRDGGVLVTRRANRQFEEFAPGCWLPWQAAVETGPPSWVPNKDHDQPVYRVVIRLKR